MFVFPITYLRQENGNRHHVSFFRFPNDRSGMEKQNNGRSNSRSEGIRFFVFLVRSGKGKIGMHVVFPFFYSFLRKRTNGKGLLFAFSNALSQTEKRMNSMYTDLHAGNPLSGDCFVHSFVNKKHLHPRLTLN